MRDRGAIAVIVVAEFLGTSLWFSANGAAVELQAALQLSPTGIGALTNAVQAGFIAGTLLLALTGLADRFKASSIFFASCTAGAAANAAFAAQGASSLVLALFLRFLVGVSLAGIYPLGMKLVMRWTRGNSGHTLALLVGMLTLGTALPHGIRGLGAAFDWQTVVAGSSLLAMVGGIAVLLLGEGPYGAVRVRKHLQLGDATKAFRVPAFRRAAFGYFGHMWELYAFWTLVPFFVMGLWPASPSAVSYISFAIIGIGAVGCFAGGVASRRVGSARVAIVALAVSGAMCALYPWSEGWPLAARLALLLAWGLAVVADSPQFSSLSGEACPAEFLGSALALQNAIGFSITAVAIAAATTAFTSWGSWTSWLLLPGPVLGIVAMRHDWRLVGTAPVDAKPLYEPRPRS